MSQRAGAATRVELPTDVICHIMGMLADCDSEQTLTLPELRSSLLALCTRSSAPFVRQLLLRHYVCAAAGAVVACDSLPGFPGDRWGTAQLRSFLSTYWGVEAVHVFWAGRSLRISVLLCDGSSSCIRGFIAFELVPPLARSFDFHAVQCVRGGLLFNRGVCPVFWHGRQ